MSLSISDILGQKKIKKLFREPIQYSTLVNSYKKLEKAKVELISQSERSFIEILIDARQPAVAAPDCSSDIKEPIFNALVQKIRVGLMATDKIPLRDISTRILQLGTSFASDDVISRVCSNNPEYFSMKQTDLGLVVHAAESNASGLVVNEKSSFSKSRSADQSRLRAVVKKLYRTSPEMIAALTQQATFKDLLKGYNFWKEHVDDGSYVTWLLSLARVKYSENFSVYHDLVKSLLLSRVVAFLRPSCRSVLQICENLCIDRPRFITSDELHDLVLSFPKELYIHCSTSALSPTKRQVGLTATGKEIADDPTRFENSFNASSSKDETVAVSRTQSSSVIADFDLPDRLQSRIKPLLSTKVTLDYLASNCRVVITSPQMRLLFEKYGCFLNYLVAYGKAMKTKLPADKFVEHLYSLIKPDVTWALNHHSRGKSIAEIVHERTTRGLLDDAFISEAIRFFSSGAETPELPKIAGVDEDEEQKTDSPPQESDPIADLESERVLHLLTNQPKFFNIVDVFLTLPAVSISVLANNSMSFFEWLISLSKRLMPHDAPIFEAHLQGLLQKEVARLHARQHCQMTIHHVHSLLCADHSMLLSPNFLSWCLEQSNSLFCVHQSWIYLKQAIRRRPSSELPSEEPNRSTVRSPSGETGYDVEKLLLSVRGCHKLSDLLKSIRSVPLEHVGQIIQKNSYWYDFFESNLCDRKDRQILSSLLAKEAKACLEGKILKAGELLSRIAKGRTNLVSLETLVYVLRQYRDAFALAGKEGENIFVGTTCQITGDEVKCVDDHEEALMRQVLLYFPSSGSCDISTILDAINKKDSFLFKGNNVLEPDYLRCFFLMFPMLFYLRGDLVVLTCMALDTKARYRSALYPTSTTGGNGDYARSPHRGRKRYPSRRRRRHSGAKSKRRKRSRSRDRSSSSSASPKREVTIVSEVISFDGSSEDEKDRTPSGFYDEHDDKLVMDEKSNFNDSLKETIDSLPMSLVADVTTSVLLKNGGKSLVPSLLRELLITTVGTEESQQIQASDNMFRMFKKKILGGLRMHKAKFILVNNTTDPDLVSEVRVAEEGEILAELESAAKDAPRQGCPQVGEVTSTSYFPDFPPEVTSPQECPTIGSEIVEIGSPNSVKSSSTSMDDSDVIRLPTNPDSLAETNGVKCTENGLNAQTKEQDPVIVISDESCSPQEDNNPDAQIQNPPLTPNKNSPLKTSDVMKSPVRSIMASYSGSSASAAYIKQRPSHREDSKMNREEQFMEFFCKYLNINAGSCATELLIADAHRRFQTERFARSRLAFEAYVYDFTVCNGDTFELSGTGCDKGVSKISYRRTSTQNGHYPHLSFLQLIPDVCTSSLAYLSTKPQKRDSIEEICKALIEVFHCRLEKYPPREVHSTVRCLILLAAIRNLKLFCFAVIDSVLYIRHHHKQQESPESSAPPSEYRDQIVAILNNSNVREAILLMAKVLETSRPLSRAPLRGVWETEAPPALAKVFGSGLSFMLSLTKYSFLFPTNEQDGIVTVNEAEMERVRNGIV